MRPWPGHAYPLGATYDGSGTNFAIFSEVAEKVELCLFSARGKETRVRLGEVDGFFFAGELRYLWQRGLVEDRLCGCGLPLSACPFWRACRLPLRSR